jgi:hypothetical protein
MVRYILLYTILICCRPSGKVSSLTITTSDTRFYRVRFPQKKPEQAHLESTIVSKEQLFDDFFHYLIAKAPTSMKRCRSCYKSLVLQELCIQTPVICIFVYSYIPVITTSQFVNC